MDSQVIESLMSLVESLISRIDVLEDRIKKLESHLEDVNPMTNNNKEVVQQDDPFLSDTGRWLRIMEENDERTKEMRKYDKLLYESAAEDEVPRLDEDDDPNVLLNRMMNEARTKELCRRADEKLRMEGDADDW